ncbi:unnamed protein product [Oppiella nova]|uniref:Nuclear receptor domain-containing protein n=1 Tax=Oppiella nova TaxID=334625 RepID=A0A7R9QNJ3_9ACAR|nr:unnamed protein product [Oppiella nova]CAG2169173.1 unnamed protein product [Oppiella nova]
MCELRLSRCDLLFCVVCGDKAFGYNFDAITCPSCKEECLIRQIDYDDEGNSSSQTPEILDIIDIDSNNSDTEPDLSVIPIAAPITANSHEMNELEINKLQELLNATHIFIIVIPNRTYQSYLSQRR